MNAAGNDLPAERITMHTDGACSGNPGPGGWGVVLRSGDQLKHLCGGVARTTNNRMELLAAIRGLEALRSQRPVDLYTDSKYVKDGIEKWIHGWKRKGWKKADGKPVLNAELWRELDALNARHDVTWHWVKGHSGDPGNELADALAREGIERARRGDETEVTRVP